MPQNSHHHAGGELGVSSQGGALPAVSVVMPVKGCRTHSVSNWSSQLATQYGELCSFKTFPLTERRRRKTVPCPAAPCDM